MAYLQIQVCLLRVYRHVAGYYGDVFKAVGMPDLFQCPDHFAHSAN